MQPAVINIFEKAVKKAGKILLRDFGGVYVDVDAKPIRPFDLILDKCSDKITFLVALSGSPNAGCVIGSTYVSPSVS